MLAVGIVCRQPVLRFPRIAYGAFSKPRAPLAFAGTRTFSMDSRPTATAADGVAPMAVAEPNATDTKCQAQDGVFPYSASFRRVCISHILGREDEGRGLAGGAFVVGGWVRSGREQGGGSFAFVQLNDGSTAASLQVYMPMDLAEKHGGKEVLKAGVSLLIKGELTTTPEGVQQAVELQAKDILHFGACDGTKYPIAKKGHTLEFLREKAHLRARTNVFGAVARVRNALAFATHSFFQGHGFLYVHTPIITASDCEGAGEMFQVTTLLESAAARSAAATPAAELESRLQACTAEEEEVGGTVRQLKEKMKACEDGQEKGEINKEVQAAVKQLKLKKEATAAVQEELSYVGGIKRLPGSTAVDFGQDFFSKPAYLTVSGQINGEYYACSLSNVYTFGPTFRAENSHTSRHLAEFWMIEPEMAFCTLEDDMRCAEDYVRFCCKHVLENARPDLDALMAWKSGDKELVSRLQHVADAPFKRISYTEAVDLLREAIEAGHKFEDNGVKWGDDLGSEHERYICEQVFKQPTIVYNYPKEIKAFYMKLNDDQKTVAAMDVLVPGIGELVGGSQREDDIALLQQRIQEAGMDLAPYEGYLDMRRYGNVPHSGFGLGFERLVMFATGMSNIRDVIPFPRFPGNAAF